MVLAQGALPNLWLVLATVAGGTLSAGSANTFNMVIDRDIDTVMGRTQSRPLVTGEITPRAALIFASVLAGLSISLLWWLTTPLAALLSAAAIAFYVFIYTMWLKRRSEQNIIWGGIAGCFPVLIGWAAVTGSLSVEAWILFLVVFLWTPPHYWPPLHEIPGRLRERSGSYACCCSRSPGGGHAGHPLCLGNCRRLTSAHPAGTDGDSLLCYRHDDRGMVHR